MTIHVGRAQYVWQSMRDSSTFPMIDCNFVSRAPKKVSAHHWHWKSFTTVMFSNVIEAHRPKIQLKIAAVTRRNRNRCWMLQNDWHRCSGIIWLVSYIDGAYNLNEMWNRIVHSIFSTANMKCICVREFCWSNDFKDTPKIRIYISSTAYMRLYLFLCAAVDRSILYTYFH